MIINILSVTYYTFTGIVFIFILLGIIGKFGLFPLNLGIFGMYLVLNNGCFKIVPLDTLGGVVPINGLDLDIHLNLHNPV